MLLGNLRRTFRAGPVPTAERKSPMRLRKLVAAAVPLPAFLGKAGATGIEVSGNRQAVTFTGSAAQLESAFRTRIGTYHDKVSGRDFFANDAAPAVPADVSSVVGNVVGLDDHAVRTHSTAKAAKPNVVKSVTPPVLKTAYGTSGLSATGSGRKVGFVEFDGYQKSNITKYDSTYGLS